MDGCRMGGWHGEEDGDDGDTSLRNMLGVVVHSTLIQTCLGTVHWSIVLVRPS